MIAKQPYIVYQLPTGRPTQLLIGGRIEKAWTNIIEFLKECTDADVWKPKSVELIGFSGSADFNEDLLPARKIIEKSKSIFGPGITEPVSYHYPSGIPSKQTKTTWKIELSNFQCSINYVISEQPYPKYSLGPLELIVSYDFKLKNPSTKELINSQYDNSSILLWFGRRCSVSPTLHFPFMDNNNEFQELLSQYDLYTPFKLDRKLLRMVKANKKNTMNVFTRLT